ncbi:exodeoxyribonuclease V subunit gamma [Salinicola aestuarinus]|uniref:exodeoxyribonuclease V subunit gamma n=1 Tax=Salinicola aestuarinus TaxID=1949082 RepID=UPI000DA183EC|nr:exodeoxyribonuclease V subunit gamma [Salinicola aestuarinus]
MFSVLHANHLEDLRDLSLALMQRQRLPPLTPETYLVQSNGMAQWLRLSLAEADGVAASVDFPLPSSFVWRAYRAVLEHQGETIPLQSPFDKRPLAWRILRLLDALILRDPETFAPLAHYLAAGDPAAGDPAAGDPATGDPGAGDPETGAPASLPIGQHEQAERQRWQLAVRLADLFDQYLNYRPDWLAAWESGHDAPVDLPADQRWQPALWRALLDDAEAVAREHHRARLHGRFVDAARALDNRPAGLPPRVYVFGISTLPAQTLEALHALSGVIDVYLMITNPCRHYWGDIVSDREAIKRAGRLSAQALARQQTRHPEAPKLAALDEQALHLQANPLLAAWGAQGRDFIVGLYEFESQDGGFDLETDLFRDPIETPSDADREATGERAPLLNQIQQDILDLVHPGELARERGKRRLIAADDASLSLYRVHSPLREVEVLHDRLLDAFEQASREGDPLRPRDILVMVPEIDIYAPFIEAVFGQLSPSDPRHIPFTIADQVASETHPLMVLVLSLLELPERRLGVSELLDALDVPAFRARFDIDESELPRVRQWLAESGVRWGLSGDHRAALGFPALHANSWAFGLERMLLGYATGALPSSGAHAREASTTAGEGAWQFDAIVPYDEVGGLEADLAGRLAELMQVIEGQCRALGSPATPQTWLTRLRELIDAVFRPMALDEHDVLARVDQALSRWQASCELAAFETPIGLAVVRDALKAELDDGGLAQRFLAGKVNFATLMPMRAIPFRQVYLLGMNDGAYPRTRQPQDFDLMAQRPRPGDRSRRDDDRYLLLEALLSARDRITLSWVGFDQRDNTPRPPSVLIGELLDMLEQGYAPADMPADADIEAALAARLIETHPLQPFSRRYFLASDPRFTFDSSWEALHRADASAGAVREDETEADVAEIRAGEAQEPEPSAPAEALDIADLTRVLRRPWSVYLGRLGVRFQEAEVPDEDSEPFVLDALEDHTLKRELLDAGRRGEALTVMAERLRLAGRLPAAGFGLATIEAPLKRLETQLQSFRELSAALMPCEPTVLRFSAPPTPQAPPLTLESRIDGLFQEGAAAAGEATRVLITLETSHFGHFQTGRSDKGAESAGPWKKLGKPHRLYAGYLRWLLANAAGETPCRWTALFEDRWLEFPALGRVEARATLSGWLERWWRAFRRPLPAVSELTRSLWAECTREHLAEIERGEPLAPPLRDKLAAEFESGGYQRDSLIQREGGLGQLWRDFESFTAANGVAETVRHYQPFLDALLGASQRLHRATAHEGQTAGETS